MQIKYIMWLSSTNAHMCHVNKPFEIEFEIKLDLVCSQTNEKKYYK